LADGIFGKGGVWRSSLFCSPDMAGMSN
jgi:hypothetical protein